MLVWKGGEVFSEGLDGFVAVDEEEEDDGNDVDDDDDGSGGRSG